MLLVIYRGADKSLARPGRKQATETEDFDFHHPTTGRGGSRGSGRLRTRIFLTFGTTRVVSHQP